MTKRGNVLLPPPLAFPLRGRVSEPCSLWVASLSFREQMVTGGTIAFAQMGIWFVHKKSQPFGWLFLLSY
ncbi:hypothetical protein CH361_13600 [Leptospira brenneri]|nr:hypothetical protein CH361_13600 [Leptospira brenneri]